MGQQISIQDIYDTSSKKRNAIISKIESMSEDDIQLLYQSLFKEELIKGFDILPKPRHVPSEAEIDAVIAQRRKQNGFYK